MKKVWLIFSGLLLLIGCDQKPKLPGTPVAKASTLERRLLRQTQEGYFIVQDYYDSRLRYTEPFMIKRKEDLPKGLNANDQFASALDLIDSIDGPLTIYLADLWQKEEGPVILKGQYSDGKREGIWQGFYKNTQQAFQENYQQGKLEGKQQRWYESGKPRSEYYYHQGVVEGKSTLWYEETGQPLTELNFHNGLMDGAYRYWHDNGQLWIEGQFENNKKHGQWIYWNRNGDKQKIVNYNQGEITNQKQLAPAFEKVKLGPDFFCGSYQGHVLRIDGGYVISASYIFNKPKQQCKDEFNQVIISYLWPSVKPVTDNYRMRVTPNQIVYNIRIDRDLIPLVKQLNVYRTMSDKDSGQPGNTLKDPETGLWRYDGLNVPNPSKVYWGYNDQGQVAQFINCKQYRSLMRTRCKLVIYMPIYKAFISIDFLDSLLPQWPALEEQAKQFIERRIQN